MKRWAALTAIAWLLIGPEVALADTVPTSPSACTTAIASASQINGFALCLEERVASRVDFGQQGVELAELGFHGGEEAGFAGIVPGGLKVSGDLREAEAEVSRLVDEPN